MGRSSGQRQTRGMEKGGGGREVEEVGVTGHGWNRGYKKRASSYERVRRAIETLQEVLHRKAQDAA